MDEEMTHWVTCLECGKLITENHPGVLFGCGSSYHNNKKCLRHIGELEN